jgi:hypothetical protein
VDAILAHAAAVKSLTTADLRNVKYQIPTSRLLHVSTVFHRGVTTVLFLLAACGFQLDMVRKCLYRASFDVPESN